MYTTGVCHTIGILTIKDLQTVCEKIWDSRSKWLDIGLELGMNKVDLDCIETKCRGIPDECFREMLSKWLLSGGATWNVVVGALKSRVVDFGQLAEDKCV